MNTFKLLLVAIPFIAQTAAFGASLSHSGVEVEYEYEVLFRSLDPVENDGSDTADMYANFHAAHLFGLFHSPDYAKKFGYHADLIEGFAGTKAPQIIRSEIHSVNGDKYRWIRYTAKGKMLVLKNVAEKWFNGRLTAEVRLPLLLDLPAVYVDDFPTLPAHLQDYKDERWVKCTDGYYQSATDFSYFYNPFRCPSLGRAPIAQDIAFKLKYAPKAGEDKARFPHEKIYGHNGNGRLTTLYFVQGYDHAPEAGASPQKIRADVGYRVFARLQKALTEDYGFKIATSTAEFKKFMGADLRDITLSTPVTLTHYQNRTFFRTFYKRVGDKLFVVRAGLINSEYDARERGNVSFIKFWKEAWENGDFIYFGGHSGDGASLDTDEIDDSLRSRLMSRGAALEKVTPLELSTIQFRTDKTQVAFIDACSSYDHYQTMYTEKKPENLHLITYGLVSLFHNAEATIRNMLDVIIEPPQPNPLWADVLADLENDQLASHVMNLYYDEDEAKSKLERFRKSNQLPSYLINVSVPQ